MLGDHMSNVMKWPDNDKSQGQRWKLSLSVGAKLHANNSAGKSIPLRLTKFDLIVQWDSIDNTFTLEDVITESASLTGA
jgi:hypothetical protein